MFDFSTVYGAAIFSIKFQEDGTVLLDTTDGLMCINPNTTYICHGIMKVTVNEALDILDITAPLNEWKALCK